MTGRLIDLGASTGHMISRRRRHSNPAQCIEAVKKTFTRLFLKGSSPILMTERMAGRVKV